MRLLPSDPDIETLVGRINKHELDLQPDFQRGEIWALGKRQRLIDSVLRDWHVPPIHVILNEDQTVSVLDGQQRLAAIRDFVANEIPVDGSLPPHDQYIANLDGMRFDGLPFDVKRRFLRFPIRLFTIVDYRPAEPGELFYRLNQLSSLTAAEQRNAFFGETRKQVKDLVELVDQLDLGGSLFGFSNARMAYDDVVARSLFLLEADTLRQKVTSNALADRYRNDMPFSRSSINGVCSALQLMNIAQRIACGGIKLNKATAQTWIVFLASAPVAFSASSEKAILSDFMAHFELEREAVSKDLYQSDMAGIRVGDNSDFTTNLLLRRALVEYSDRSTSRVADVSSVVLRDFVLWMFLLSRESVSSLNLSDKRKLKLVEILRDGSAANMPVEYLADELSWGERL